MDFWTAWFDRVGQPGAGTGYWDDWFRQFRHAAGLDEPVAAGAVVVEPPVEGAGTVQGALEGLASALAVAGGGGMSSVAVAAPLTGNGTPGAPVTLPGDLLTTVAVTAPLTGTGTAASPLTMPANYLSAVAVAAPLSGTGISGAPVSLGVVPLAQGGTGANNAAAARTNLGITPLNIGAQPAGFYLTTVVVTSPLLTGSGTTANPVTLSGLVPLANGGTGANNAVTARNNLGALATVAVTTPLSGNGTTGSPVALPAYANIEPITFVFGGVPAAGSMINVPLVMNLSITASNLSTQSRYYNVVNPASVSTFQLRVMPANTLISTITVNTAGTATFGGAGSTTLVAGNVLRMTAVTVGNDLCDVGITIYATRR